MSITEVKRAMNGEGTLCHNDGMEYARRSMLHTLAERGVSSGSVLSAMAHVPRHLFVSEALCFNAYKDNSLPIGHGQTASKPSTVGRMIQALGLTGSESVLEIGTGSGYQTALLSHLASQVVSIERIKELSLRARQVLIRLNYQNVKVIHTENFMEIDGIFDAVIVSAGAPRIPEGIFSKVKVGGVMVIPLGSNDGHHIKRYVKKSEDSVVEEEIGFATFVPLVMRTVTLS